MARTVARTPVYRTMEQKRALLDKVIGTQGFCQYDQADVPDLQDALQRPSLGEVEAYYNALPDYAKEHFHFIVLRVLDENSAKYVLQRTMYAAMRAAMLAEVQAEVYKATEARELAVTGRERHMNALENQVVMLSKTNEAHIAENANLRRNLEAERANASALESRIERLLTLNREVAQVRDEFMEKYEGLRGALAVVGKAMGVEPKF